MTSINWGRVIGGGLLAGLIINASEFVLNALVLAKDWEAAMRALGKSGMMTSGQIAMFYVWGFLVGLFAVWLYASIRPRYGIGPKTAVCAGLSVWFAVYVMASIGMVAMEMFPARLVWISLAWGLPEAVLSTLAGAAIYKE